jgi:hypothetical protein
MFVISMKAFLKKNPKDKILKIKTFFHQFPTNVYDIISYNIWGFHDVYVRWQHKPPNHW